MKNKTKYALLALTLTLPALVLAAPLGGLKSLLQAVRDLLDLAIPVMYGICLIFFFWGLGQFILHDAGNDKTREDGKKKMLWGIVALFVFISIKGILSFIGQAVGLEPTPGGGVLPANTPYYNIPTPSGGSQNFPHPIKNATVEEYDML